MLPLGLDNPYAGIPRGAVREEVLIAADGRAAVRCSAWAEVVPSREAALTDGLAALLRDPLPWR